MEKRINPQSGIHPFVKVFKEKNTGNLQMKLEKH